MWLANVLRWVGGFVWGCVVMVLLTAYGVMVIALGVLTAQWIWWAVVLEQMP